jgi:60S ribosome subunit biogenesis protein NIP7
MQANKDTLRINIRRCSQQVVDKTIRHVLTACLGITRDKAEEALSKIVVLCKYSGPGEDTSTVDVYIASKTLEDVLQILKHPVEIITIGVHSFRVKKKVLPLLGFVSIIRRYGLMPIKGYAIVNEKGEKLFLYGRDVFSNNIIELKEPGCRQGYIMVLNMYKEPLGWGKIRRGHDTIYIQNVIDAGWYLRSGV